MNESINLIKISSQFLVLLSSIWLGATNAVATSAPFTIVDPESGAAPVLIAASVSDLTRTNAEELAQLIEQMSGHLPIIETEAGEGRALCVGTASEFPDAPRVGDLQGLGPEAFVLHSTTDRLYIVGNSDLGVQVGIFTLLRELGCRWFFPHEAWTIIPEQRSLHVDVSTIDSPDFDYRRIWYGWGARTPKLAADYGAWNRHNRFPGWFGIACSHAWAQFAPGSLFEENPEYFALKGGTRVGHQPCTTHPDVIQLATDHVIRTFEKEPQRNMAPFDPNDNGEFCEDDRCLAQGTISDRVFHFANTVAEGLTAQFPDKYLGLLSYAWHTDPPSFRLHPNVYVQLTRGLRRTKMTWEEQIEAWSDKASAFGIYDYFSLHEWDGSMPGKAKGGNVAYLRENIPHFHRLGATTLDGQSGCNWAPNGLGYYLTTQLTWNVDADVDGIVDDFYATAFAEAAVPVRRFYERWQDSNEMSERTLVLAYRDLAAARELVATPGVEGRLDHLMMYLHWLRLKHEFARVEDPQVILAVGRELIQFARRIMDTGLIHSQAIVLGWDYYKRQRGVHGYEKVTELEGVTDEMVESWKTDRTDIPAHEEVARLFDEGLELYGDRVVLEALPTQWSRDLVPVAIQASESLLELLGEHTESPFFFEQARYYFPAEAGEVLILPFVVYPDHTLDGHWTLANAETGEVVEEGDIRRQQDESAQLRLQIQRKGLYMLDPGTDYQRGGRLEFDRRPQVVEASPESEFMALYPGTPTLDQPLYFFVPRDTGTFVVRIHANTSHESDVRFYGPDGKLVAEHLKLVTGSDLSVPVDVPVTVPAGADDGIWAFTISRSPRAIVQLRGIPPYLARHPEELLTSREAVVR